MTIVKQYNIHACFVACLESFYRDNGKTLSQQQTVKDNPDLFYVGDKTEGSCDTTSFEEVARRLGIGYEHVNTSAFQGHYPTDTILFYVLWLDDPKNNHCVRFHSVKDNNNFTVMNPNRADSLDTMPTSWIQTIFRFSMPNANVA